MRNDQRGHVQIADDVGHGERLARARHAQQAVKRLASLKRLRELGDGLRLIAAGFKLTDQLESIHNPLRHACYSTIP